MLLDAWIWRQKGKPYDKDAQWASEGKVLLPLLQDMLSDPWFALPAPKSTGREYFNYGWLEQHMARYPGLRGEDVQATLAELTAVTISEQVLLSGGCERLLVCGGGARNPLLMSRLAALLPGLTLEHLERRAKYLIWTFRSAAGEKRWLLTHNQLFYQKLVQILQ